jgi:hypothetical protein
MSAGREDSPHLGHIVERYIRPISIRVLEVLRQGIATSEFRDVDPAQFAPTMAAAIVSYFVSPVVRRLRTSDPYAAEAVKQRRAAVLDFIAAALFVDRAAGLKLAAEVAARPAEQTVSSKATTTHRTNLRRRRK